MVVAASADAATGSSSASGTSSGAGTAGTLSEVNAERSEIETQLDMIFGTGLGDELQLTAPSPALPFGYAIPNGDHTPSYAQWNFGLTHALQYGAPGPLTGLTQDF